MATKGIDFTTLTLMDALDLAVLIEEEARDRYAELADQMEVHHTADAGAFFRKMVRVEEVHRSELARRRKDMFGDAPVKVARTMIFDVEAPDYDVARANMTPFQALEAAMASEVKAHDFFAAAVPRVKDLDVRALFEELREEELEHQGWLKVEMDNRPATKDVPGDVEDEPVAHD